MAEIRLHDTPVCHSREFYQTRSAVDHIKQPHHSLRLLVLSAYVVYYSRFDRNVQDKPFPKIGDFGCGTGGLMKYLSGLVPARCELYGYDLSPEAVNYAQGIRFLDVQLKDFVNEKVEYPDIMIVSEVLEHLPDPHRFLRKIPKETIVVASVPAQETETRQSANFFMEDGFFNIKPFHTHRFKALEDSILLETSVGADKDTLRVYDEYQRVGKEL